MPIRTRITGKGERADILRKKPKARHPLLVPGSRTNAVYQTILQEGNPKGGITAAQIKRSCHFYHPQVLKDLLDHRLIARRDKNDNNQFRYVADERGRGTYVQEVEVQVELFEDSEGRFFTRTTLVGQQGRPGMITRLLARRRIKFNVPLPTEPGVMEVKGFVNVDNAEGYSTSAGSSTPRYFETAADKVEDPLLLEADATIIEG